jgi:hypothetical protein
VYTIDIGRIKLNDQSTSVVKRNKKKKVSKVNKARHMNSRCETEQDTTRDTEENWTVVRAKIATSKEQAKSFDPDLVPHLHRDIDGTHKCASFCWRWTLIRARQDGSAVGISGSKLECQIEFPIHTVCSILQGPILTSEKTLPDFHLASIFGRIRSWILLFHPYVRGMMRTWFGRIHRP